MEPLSVSEAKKQIIVTQSTLNSIVGASKYGAQVVRSIPSWTISTLQTLSLAQKVLLFSVTLGGSFVVFMTKYCRRKRRPLRSKNLRAASRRARQLSLSGRSGVVDEPVASSRRGNANYNWIELQQKAAASADKDSVTSAATLVDGTPLSPQQLGLMGMEALETVVAYWEDALAAYQPKNGMNHVITTAEEAAFVKMLENILDVSYNIQEEAEHMFIYQDSVLNRPTYINKRRVVCAGDVLDQPTEATDGTCVSTVSSRGGHNVHFSVSSVDQESFVSAQDTIADLKDFEDLNEILGDADSAQVLYLESLDHLEKVGIPYRVIRTDFVGCSNDTEYLAKLHCLRLAFRHIMSKPEDRSWWVDNGRKILSDLMVKSDKDPKDFFQVYDGLLEYLKVDEHMELMGEELKSRNVKCTNFYDIVLDYILIDSFEDLESPPSSVIAVMNNRWLSNSFKETALQTAIWSVLKAKRRLLHYPDGFKAQFYSLSEIIIPTLAWGFFGPDERLNGLMNYFKDQVLAFTHGLYDSSCVRYTNIDDMSADIMALARTKFEQTTSYMEKHGDS